jgi:hypothetical protein
MNWRTLGFFATLLTVGYILLALAAAGVIR